MPLRYECILCTRIFGYTEICLDVEHPQYPNRYVTITIDCRQETFTQGLGSTGKDYVCDECIREAVMKGESH